jgi:hypothetical protein
MYVDESRPDRGTGPRLQVKLIILLGKSVEVLHNKVSTVACGHRAKFGLGSRSICNRHE